MEGKGLRIDERFILTVVAFFCLLFFLLLFYYSHTKPSFKITFAYYSENTIYKYYINKQKQTTCMSLIPYMGVLILSIVEHHRLVHEDF